MRPIILAVLGALLSGCMPFIIAMTPSPPPGLRPSDRTPDRAIEAAPAPRSAGTPSRSGQP